MADEKTISAATISMPGVQKAAILMLALNPDATKMIFNRLENYEIKKVTDSMAALGLVQPERTMAVVNEFAKKLVKGGSTIYTDDELIKKVLFNTMDEKRASQIFSQLNLGKDSALRTLNTYDARTLANFLSNEHPQTVAILLAHLKPDKVGQVLKYMPEDVRIDAITRLASLDDITPETLNDLEEAVRSAFSVLGTGAKHTIGGIDPVAETLNRLEKKIATSLLEGISARDPELADKIKGKMFVFEDITMIDDRGIQEILKNVDNDELVLALKVSTDELKARIFSNMSERAAKILQEDLEVMGPVKVSDVEKSQQNILKIVDRLVEEGRVVIASETEDEIVR